jgi:hypothetical protein
MDSAAKTAIRSGYDVFTANLLREMHNPVGNQLGVFQNVGRMADHPRDDDPTVGKLRVAPDLPLVLVFAIWKTVASAGHS